MTNESISGDSWKRPLGEFITAFVLLTHAIVFFQLVICSKNMVVSFNIPTKNIGIYLGKLSGIRSLLMSVGGAAEYGFYRIINFASSNHGKTIRQSVSVFSLTCLTITRLIFLIFLYYPETASFRNYIVLIIGAFFVGSFQISAFSLSPHVSALSWLSVYLSGILSFVIQVILDMCWSKRPSLTFKIQSWISLILSIISVGLWPCNLFLLTDDGSSKNAQGSQNQSTCSITTQSASVSSSSSGAESSASGGGGSNGEGSSPSGSSQTTTSPKKRSADGFHEHPSVVLDQHDLKMEYLMTMNSVTIMKIMNDQLDKLCSQLSSEAVANVRILMTRLQQIRSEGQITYDVLVAIDLVILGLKKCGCQSDQLFLLAELSLFLRMKVIIKPLGEQKEENTIQELSYAYGGLGVQNGKQCSSGEPVVLASARYTQLIKSGESSSIRAKPSVPEESQSPRRAGRTRRSTQSQTGSNGEQSIYYSISPFLMFGAGSLVKDFLFPGVIPYGLLERDKCHLINLIVIIFLSIGPIAVFVLDKVINDFKCKHIYYHGFWFCMIPEIVIFLISLSAIHSKQGCTHQIRSSRWRVFLMTMILLTCYGFLETVNIVGVPNIAKTIFPDLIPINNIFGKFIRYFVYKLSVGYNKTRISAGFTLPNFKPPEPIPNSFGFWCKGSFSNGWKDIKSDFKFNIKQYLAVGPTPSKKSPIEALRYCDIFM